MWHPGRGRLRVARSWCAGLVVALVAAVSHLLGGGSHTSWLAVLPAALAVTVTTAALGSRRLSRGEIVALLVTAQAGVHILSSYLHGMPLWHHQSMLAAHVAGVLVTALLLAHGEALLWRLYAWLRPLVRTARAAVEHCAPRAVAVAHHAVATPVILGAVGRRGPPVGDAHLG